MSTEQKSFEHPLARKARVWTGKGKDGKDQDLLVVLTTLGLDSKAAGFSDRNFKRLSRAAQEFVSANPRLDGYILINRAKDW